jgi:regulatory protein YycI of two-component signal transduction system YycFG
LDKSIDSRNHSEKSKKSNESATKKNDKNEKSFKQTEIHIKRDLPKIPISPKHTIQTKSPTKNIFYQTAYPQTRTGQSPPKIIGSKSKNKL